MTQIDGTYNTKTPVLLGLNDLLEPRAFGQKRGQEAKAGSVLKYTAALAFDPAGEDMKNLKTLAVQVAKGFFPGRDVVGDSRLSPKLFAFPFKDGTVLADKRNAECARLEKKPDGDWQRGKIIISARSKYQPALGVIVAGKVVDLDNPALIAQYKKLLDAGMEAYVQIKLVGYKGVGANPDGVNAYLNIVTATGKGAAIFSGGRSASETFGGYAGKVSAEAPSAGLDDEIPF